SDGVWRSYNEGTRSETVYAALHLHDFACCMLLVRACLGIFRENGPKSRYKPLHINVLRRIIA
ncbi:hypothetical protein ACJBWD_10490, partial [Streptococcus suis]